MESLASSLLSFGDNQWCEEESCCKKQHGERLERPLSPDLRGRCRHARQWQTRGLKGLRRDRSARYPQISTGILRKISAAFCMTESGLVKIPLSRISAGCASA